MPYAAPSELPEYVRKHSKKKQREWRAIWNSVYKETGSEDRAFAAANAILKQEAAMDMNTILQARLDCLREILEQAGKRISAATAEKIKVAIETLNALVAEESPEEEAVEQAWAPIDELFLQQTELLEYRGQARKDVSEAAKKFGIEISEGKTQETVPIGHLIEQENGNPPFLLQEIPLELTLVQKKADGTVTFGGVATHGNVLNSEKQVYTTGLWQSHMGAIGEMLTQGRLVGATWHPRTTEDKPRDPYIHELSHKFTSMGMDGDLMRFEAQTINTQAGKDLAAVLEANVGLHMSTRATGTLTQGEWEGGKAYIVDQDKFQLHGIDVVLDGASPGSAIEYVRLQEAQKGKTMDPEEIKKLIQEGMAAGSTEMVGKFKELEDRIGALGQAPSLSDEDKALLQQSKVLTDEAKDTKRLQARDAKIDEVIGKTEEIPEQFRPQARRMLQRVCQSEETVDAEMPLLLQDLKPLIAANAGYQSRGFYVSEYKSDGSKIKVHTPHEAIEDLLQSRIERGVLPKDTGINDPSNMVRNTRIMLQSMAIEHPEYIAGYMRLKNGDLRDISDARDLLTQDYKSLIQDIPAGAMTTDDVATAIPYLLPIVTELVPQLIATRYASVQPMTRSLGTIAYWKIHDEDDNEIKDPAHFTGSYAKDPGEKETIKRLKGSLTTENISPTAKKLGYDLSIEVIRRLRTDWGMDASGVMVQECAAEIAREWNYNHLQSMVSGAAAGNWNYGTDVPVAGTFDGEQWQKQLINYLYSARSGIYDETYAPTVAILGPSTRIMRILWLAKEVGFARDTTPQGNIARGVDIQGQLTTGEELVSVAWWEHLGLPNTLLLIARGSEWYRTGFVIAPYLGLYVTPVWVDPDTIDVQQAMLSEVAEKMVDGNYFATVTVQDGVDGIEL